MEQIKTITGETFDHETLANGLPVYVMNRPGFQKKYAIFATKYGSLDSKFEVAGKGLLEVPDGIAHFLEHKLFEEESGEHVFEKFARYGASVNAFTSYTMTAYLFSATENFTEAFNELLRFVQNPYLTSENVEKEKGIIEQELRMYDDHPDRRIYRNLLNGLYHHHPVRIDVGGTVESIQKIDVDLLMECYNLFYQPKNMAVFVIGDLDSQQIIDQVKAQTDDWNYQETAIKRIYPDEPSHIYQPRIEQVLSVSQPRYYLGFKDQPQADGNERLKQQFIMNMIWRLIAARSSPIYEKLYNQGIVDDSFGASFQAAPQYAFSVIGGETDQPELLDQELRQIITKLQSSKIAADELERMKRRSLGNYLAAFNSLEYIANSFISHLFSGTSFVAIPEVLESITLDDLHRYLETGLNLKQAAVSLIKPE